MLSPLPIPLYLRATPPYNTNCYGCHNPLKDNESVIGHTSPSSKELIHHIHQRCLFHFSEFTYYCIPCNEDGNNYLRHIQKTPIKLVTVSFKHKFSFFAKGFATGVLLTSSCAAITALVYAKLQIIPKKCSFRTCYNLSTSAIVFSLGSYQQYIQHKIGKEISILRSKMAIERKILDSKSTLEKEILDSKRVLKSQILQALAEERWESIAKLVNVFCELITLLSDDHCKVIRILANGQSEEIKILINTQCKEVKRTINTQCDFIKFITKGHLQKSPQPLVLQAPPNEKKIEFTNGEISEPCITFTTILDDNYNTFKILNDKQCKEITDLAQNQRKSHVRLNDRFSDRESFIWKILTPFATCLLGGMAITDDRIKSPSYSKKVIPLLILTSGITSMIQKWVVEKPQPFK